MSVENLRRLAERAESVEGRQAERLDELHARIRAVRRQRALGSSLVAASVVGVLVAGGALVVQGTDDTREEIPQKTPTPTPSETVAIPDGQVTVTAQIEPGDVRGWELRGSRTNVDAGFVGATDLDLVVETGELYGGQSNVTAFCQGDTDTWWVLTYDLDGVNGYQGIDGAQPDGSRGMYGRCSPGDPTTAPSPTEPIDLNRYNAKPMAYPFRMFVTDELPESTRSCIRGGEDAVGCVADLAPLDTTDASFGFGVFEHTTSPRVLEVLDEIRFEALALADGVEYLVDRAVEAAPGSDRLVVTLPPSDRPRIVALHFRETDAMERCIEKLGFEVDGPETFAEEQEARQRHCANELVLRVDGDKHRADHDWYLGSQQVLVPPGAGHVVTVDVVENDPRNTRYAVVIWEARS